jgi:uncharacterized membrane protein
MKPRVGIALLGLLIFLLGGIAGAVSHILYQEHLRTAFFKAVQQPPDIVGGMARELKLDSEQTESLKTIFDESRKRYMDLSQQFWPQFETIRVETNQQIMNILRDDQKVRFEDFLKKVPAPPAPREAVQGKKEEKKPAFNPKN